MVSNTWNARCSGKENTLPWESFKYQTSRVSLSVDITCIISSPPPPPPLPPRSTARSLVPECKNLYCLHAYSTKTENTLPKARNLQYCFTEFDPVIVINLPHFASPPPPPNCHAFAHASGIHTRIIIKMCACVNFSL